jgi:hypothetical protein
MTELTIKTNNQPRSLFNPCELSQSQRAKLRRQFDWMDDEQFDHNCSFFLYRGWYYNLCDFLTNTNPDGMFKGWHAIASDSYFTGTLVKLCGNDVIVGRYSS